MSDPLAEPNGQRPPPAKPPDPPTPAGLVPGHPGRDGVEGYNADDFFGEQPSSRSALPDPEPLLINLTRCVIEVLAGARELDQLARWVSDDVYRHLLKRVVLSARARAVKGQRAQRPAITIGRVTINEPRDGIIEAVVIVHSKVRVRAVAVRLEGLDNRWRASAINVL